MSLFTMKGRLGRQKYIVTSIIIAVVTYGVAFAIGFASGMAGASEDTAGAMGFVIGMIAAVVQSFLIVRRLHDLGKPGWHYWLFFIPLYNIYLGLILLFTKGANGSNEFGPDPVAV